MPTIKRKVEMNLPELIEWLFRKRNLDDEIFLSNKHNSVHVTDDGILEFYGTFYNDTFTVEIEEDLTEDTVIPEMLTIYDKGVTHLTNNKSLNNLIKNNLKSAYIMNDDLRLILIWRDGKLVE